MLEPAFTLGRGQADTRHPDYQELKGRIHQELLSRVTRGGPAELPPEPAKLTEP